MQAPLKKNLKTDLMKRLRPLFASEPYARAEELLISVSGGLDSMVLLDVLNRMSHVHRTPLRVLHVHHHTGDHADEACKLVASFCKELQLPLIIEHFKWSGSGNFEYEAAGFRRKALAAERAKSGWVVLGHHLQDQAETLIQTLVRGAGAATPLGMAPERDRRLRPFLDIEHELLERHARGASVPFLADPSNEDLDRFRNAVRRQVMPVLRSFHGRFEARLSHWAEDYRRLQNGLRQEARSLFQAHSRHGLLRREVFKVAPAYLWDYILAFFWSANGAQKPQDQERRQLLTWLNEDRCGVLNHGGSRFYCDLDGLILWPATEPAARTYHFGEVVQWGAGSFWCQVLDPAFCATASVGLSSAGDRAISKKIRDRLREARTPHRVRAALPMLTVERQTYHYLELIGFEKRGRLQIRLDLGVGTEALPLPSPRTPRLEPI